MRRGPRKSSLFTSSSHMIVFLLFLCQKTRLANSKASLIDLKRGVVMMHLNAITSTWSTPHLQASSWICTVICAMNSFLGRKIQLLCTTKLVTPIFCKVIPGGDLSLDFPPLEAFMCSRALCGCTQLQEKPVDLNCFSRCIFSC